MPDFLLSDDLPALDPREQVARIVYASQATLSGPVFGEMDRIREAALRHNPPLGVATALLHQSGWFVQWKEGPEAAIRQLMDRVAADPRHAGLRMVHASLGRRLLAGPWSMAIVPSSEPFDALGRRVRALQARLQQGSQDSPPAVWRHLSTPSTHVGADQQDHASAFHRVLVVAAAGMASFDLVAWLAQRHGEPVVHRRFAGARELDVGSDYVDIAADGRLQRVIAMARRGLSVPLTRAFLPDYAHVLVLLSGDVRIDDAVVQRLARACAQAAPSPPLLVGIGARAQALSAAGLQARRLGLDWQGLLADPHDAEAVWDAACGLWNGWCPGVPPALQPARTLIPV